MTAMKIFASSPSFPRMTRPSSIGKGVQFFNRHLSSRLFRDAESLVPLLEFMRLHKYKGQILLLNESVGTIAKLRLALIKAKAILIKLPADQPFKDFAAKLQALGLEKGWDDMARRVLEMIHLLLDLLQALDPETLEKFLARIPMVFSVAIISPHGYFGQADVLGMPDTRGQVVYILDRLEQWKRRC